MAERHPAYNPGMLDQQFLNILVAEDQRDVSRAPLCLLDDRSTLFFNLYGGCEELEFEKGKPVNTLCGTRPLFIHASGQWPVAETMAKYERSLQQ
jgi:hypothetical protein